MRVLLAEDSALFREGLARLLTEAGHVITAAVGDAGEVHAAVELDRPDLVIMDVRVPPTMTDDGVQAATRLRERYPELPILLLSQHIETRHCAALATTNSFGYLLKDRVLDVDDFLDTMQRVVHSGSALDPEVVRALIAPRGTSDPLRLLTEREIQVLELVATGLSKTATARWPTSRWTARWPTTRSYSMALLLREALDAGMPASMAIAAHDPRRGRRQLRRTRQRRPWRRSRHQLIVWVLCADRAPGSAHRYLPHP